MDSNTRVVHWLAAQVRYLSKQLKVLEQQLQETQAMNYGHFISLDVMVPRKSFSFDPHAPAFVMDGIPNEPVALPEEEEETCSGFVCDDPFDLMAGMCTEQRDQDTKFNETAAEPPVEDDTCSGLMDDPFALLRGMAKKLVCKLTLFEEATFLPDQEEAAVEGADPCGQDIASEGPATIDSCTSSLRTMRDLMCTYAQIGLDPSQAITETWQKLDPHQRQRFREEYGSLLPASLAGLTVEQRPPVATEDPPKASAVSSGPGTVSFRMAPVSPRGMAAGSHKKKKKRRSSRASRSKPGGRQKQTAGLKKNAEGKHRSDS